MCAKKLRTIEKELREKCKKAFKYEETLGFDEVTPEEFISIIRNNIPYKDSYDDIMLFYYLKALRTIRMLEEMSND